MSLYDGIGLGAQETSDDKDTVGAWASGLKLIQSQDSWRKATLTQIKRDKERLLQATQSIPKPTITPAFNTPPPRKRELPVSSTSHVAAAKSGISSLVSSPLVSVADREAIMPPLSFIAKEDKRSGGKFILFGEVEVDNEYCPLYPNDYDKIQREKEHERSRKREEEKRRDAEEREKRSRHRHVDDDYEDEGDVADISERRRDRDERRSAASAGAAIAPPSSLIEQDRRILEEAGPLPQPPRSEGPTKGLGIAAKIMERMGYKQGAGLGKMEQGMSTALSVEKVSKRGGKIIHERDDVPVSMPEPTAAGDLSTDAPSITEIIRHPSKVLLLRNMVGPGEVDTELDAEVKEECSKYGDVLKCLVFEIPEASDDEAVRIFVEFAKQDHAIKAAIDLHGRYFGGRMVKAGFYDLDKFRRFELAE